VVLIVMLEVCFFSGSGKRMEELLHAKELLCKK
jgi:hypothetical protein